MMHVSPVRLRPIWGRVGPSVDEIPKVDKTMTFSTRLKTTTLGALLGATLFAAPSWAADITVTNAWARASAGMARAGAAFLTITNSGSSDDRLLAASAPVSGVAELHTHIKEGDVMRMRRVEDIPVKAGETVTLQPGGLHVMFMGLNDGLKEGQTFPLTLTFENAGTVETTVTVGAAGAMGATGAMDHSTMDHSQMGHGSMGQPSK
jgi:copper(I)-binding protein